MGGGSWNLQFLVPLPYRCYIPNLVKIGQIVLEKKTHVARRTTDDGRPRTPTHSNWSPEWQMRSQCQFGCRKRRSSEEICHRERYRVAVWQINIIAKTKYLQLFPGIREYSMHVKDNHYLEKCWSISTQSIVLILKSNTSNSLEGQTSMPKYVLIYIFLMKVIQTFI